MPKFVKNSTQRPEQSSDATITLTTKHRIAAWQQQVISKHWRLAISAACTTVAAGAVWLNLGIVNLWERQVQSLFFEVRGPVDAPENIVILAIDDESLSQGQHYREEPERYEVLKPIGSWPWQRQAYGLVIDKLMQAGADAVAVDVLFTAESSYGPADDDALTEVLSRYGDSIVLAADYSSDFRTQGVVTEPLLPLPQFENAGVRIGSINFHKEPNGQIHRLSQTFLADIEIDDGWDTVAVASEDDSPVSFAQATLEAARRPYDKKPRENIFFHGPHKTFRQIPFWYVLDDDPWQNHLQSGRFFEDKVVIIGTTAAIQQDFHEAPFSQSLLHPQSMAGVEILANTIATLERDIAPTQLIKSPKVNALMLLGLGLGIAVVANRTVRPSRRAIAVGGGLGLWVLVSYVAFVTSQTILITGTPLVAIATMGLIDFGVGFTADRFKRQRLRTALERYATSPVVQEIISQQDDFQDLLDVNRSDIVGAILRDRYQILEVLGSGGFGETYLARDTQRPGDPVCVVKQLKIVSDNPKAHHLARRLFEAEAVVLGELGEHSQIPRLLAYFEIRQSFYLVQEMVEGRLLRNILSRSRPLSQKAVVNMLKDLLPVVSFVHSKGVIHRDIKPSNIIRRKRDNRYVLIDFGAVKTISNKLTEDAGPQVTSTVGIGTQGYMPSEQSAGMPTVRSDIYALGITAIEALTGRPPHAFKRGDDGEIIWSHKVENLSPALSQVISKMVRYDFNKRYDSSELVLADLMAIEDEQLTDDPNIVETDFSGLGLSNDLSTLDGDTSEGAEAENQTTYNQGTRPGVIPTNPALENTQILPDDWLNNLETQSDEKNRSEET
ncbi:MAG: serine/threonine-protein kinase [Cyanobacteria bacterium J06632_3]